MADKRRGRSSGARSGRGQFPLPLSTPPRFGREDLMVGAPNQTALDWLDRWPDWPGPVTVLAGPKGSGKSHLATIWQQQSKAQVLTAAALNPDAIGALVQAHRCFILDDVHVLAGKAGAEQALFHLFNWLREQGGYLLLAALQEPSRWGVKLPDLLSRLNAAAILTLSPPDDAMLAAILVKQFADRQLEVGSDVVDYLLSRIERSYAAAGLVVAGLDQTALAEQRRITVPLARRLLSELEEAQQLPLDWLGPEQD
jgi:DnaA regulatory inactivator Hda